MSGGGTSGAEKLGERLVKEVEEGGLSEASVCHDHLI
jgi:hypothetical protein